MDSDPLDQLQAMFPSIEGDVIAIVLNESDKDVCVTVEKLLQLVPDNISKTEFPSLPSATRSPQQHPNFLQTVSPQRSSSGPPGTSGQRGGDSPWTNQQRNRRLQGPMHIPPNAKQQQQKVVGGTGNQRNQPKMHGQQNLRLHPQQEFRGPPTQSILGKRVPPGNQKISRASTGGGGESGNQGEMFYQMGGSGANSSMPAALGHMDPTAASLYYQNTAAVRQHQSQTRQTGFSRTDYPHPPAVLHHRAPTPVQHGGHQPQPGGNKHWPPPVMSGGTNTYSSIGGGGGGMYGYANFGQDGQYYGGWMNPGARPGDYMDQFYRSGQQSWPNISESGLQYGKREAGTGTGAMRSYGSDYYAHVMGSLTGGDSSEGAKKSDWPVYSSGSGSIQEHKANLDAIAALLHPETSPLSDGQFGRHGYVCSEPSDLASLVQHQSYEGEGTSGHVGRGERVEHRGKRDVVATGEERVADGVGGGGEGQSAGKGQSAASGEVRSGGGDRKARSERARVGDGRGGSKPKKLIILRGLPGSGKTTLARNRVGANGVICCTDDFFVTNGEYVFNPTLLEENHEKNRRKARDAMVAGHSPVIIDNTNTNAWEMKPYVLLAMENGYNVEILEPDTPWRFKTSELARRNNHNVPKHKIEKMLERYDHRVTLETIVKSQPPERKPSTETGKNDDGNGGQKGGRSKVSPPTPRHQQEGGGGGNVDHTPAPAHQTIPVNGNPAYQTRSGRVSPRVDGTKGQRSNDGRVSPRPSNQKTQKSKDNAVARNGAERKPVTEGVVSGGTQGKASDSKKKSIPHGQQQPAQANHTSQTSANSSKNQKGKKNTQQASKKANLPASASGSHGKRRAVSPARNQSSKPSSNGSSSVGAGERERRGGKDKTRKLNNGVHDATRGSEKDRKKEDRDEEEEDEFLWDSSEEAEILDGDVGNRPVCMTDTPPVGMPFRPLPQVGKSPLVNGVSGGERVSSEDATGKQLPSSQQRGVPIFEVWNDSDDEDIVDGERWGEEDESPLPNTWLETGGKGHGGHKGHVKGHGGHGEGQALPRTPELANIHQPDDSKVYASTVGTVLAPSPSQPWERTQSAANFNDVNEHFVSLIRRVQSANPSRPLNSLTEESSNQLVQDTNDDSYDVFSLSCVWGSESGLLSSKMALFDSKSNAGMERIDSLGKSSPSVQSAESAESQSEKQQKRVQSSYFSMLDALMEESTLDGGVVEREGKDTSGLNAERRSKVNELRLLDEAVSTTQDAITVQKAIEDEIKCPLRSKLISELVEEKTSLLDLEQGVPSIATELASVGLETVVDVGHMIPMSSSGDEQGGSKAVPPPFYDESDGGNPFSEEFLVSVDFDRGSNLETLTDKVFDEEPLSPQQSLSMLQASLQSVVSGSVLDPAAVVSSFVTAGDVLQEGEAESSDSLREEDSAMFDDPAILSKVCIESREEAKQPNLIKSLMTLQEMSQDVQESFSEKTPTPASPDSVEPINVFPSAYDEGINVNFELSTKVHPSVIVAEEEYEEVEKGEEPRMSPNDQSQESPQQSQTPVNEPLEVKGDDSSSQSASDGCGLEPADTPLPTEDKEELDEIEIVIEEPALSSSSLDQYVDDSNPSSSTESAGPSSTFVSDLRFLSECFPDQDEAYVSTILRMCNERVDEALSVLLVSHSNQNDLSMGQTLFGSHFCADTTDDGSSSISSASCSEQQLVLNLDRLHPSDSSPEQQQQQRVARPVFSIGGFEEEDEELADTLAAEKQLVPYFHDSECENDEEIARALQEQLDLEVPSDSGQTKEGEDVNATGETAIPDHQRERSSSHGKPKERTTFSGDENLELKLSLSLARQLQNMFGPVTDYLPFEGDMREEDMVVLLSERAAREIYKKWVDTLKAKKIGYQFQYRALSESNAISDEVLASLLQEEEDKKAREKLKKKHHKLRHSTEPCSLAALANEKFRAHHNSSPPQLGHKGPPGFVSSSPQSGGNLAEIMDEQMAQQVHQNELAKVVEAKTGPNLSLRLQLKDLHGKFPDLEQSLVNETLVRNKFDIEATIAELKGVIGQPPPPPSAKDDIDGNVFGGGLLTFSSKSSNKKVKKRSLEVGHGGRYLAKSKVYSDGEEEGKTSDEGAMGYQAVTKDSPHQPSYIELRAEAALHAKLRAENFMKAAHARGGKQWEVAQYYAHQGHLHTEKMNEANQRAAKAILEHNTKSSDELDLHGLHVDEAIAALQEKLDSCKGSKLRVVTGQGLHSKGGGAKIRPAVISYLENKHYKILYERNAGALTVKIT